MWVDRDTRLWVTELDVVQGHGRSLGYVALHVRRVDRSLYLRPSKPGQEVTRPVGVGGHSGSPVEDAVVPKPAEFFEAGVEDCVLARHVTGWRHGAIAPGGDHLAVRENVDVEVAAGSQPFLAVVGIEPVEGLDVRHALGEVHRAAVHSSVDDSSAAGLPVDHETAPAARAGPAAAGTVADDE